MKQQLQAIWAHGNWWRPCSNVCGGPNFATVPLSLLQTALCVNAQKMQQLNHLDCCSHFLYQRIAFRAIRWTL